jgi:hypothetical protein
MVLLFGLTSVGEGDSSTGISFPLATCNADAKLVFFTMIST